MINTHTNQQQDFWVLMYPPIKEGGHPEVQFHSVHPDTKVFVKHDESNISTTVIALSGAFNNPEKAAKSKHMALAKYYYLKALAARETRGASELQIPISVTRTFVESLRVVCREFETVAKEAMPHLRSRSPSATLVGSDESELSDPPEDLFDLTQPVEPSSSITLETSPVSAHDASSQRLESLLAIHNDEAELQISERALETEQAELEVARQEIEGENRRLEQRRRIHEGIKAEIAARRENLFKGMDAVDAFRLGGEIERLHAEKRRKFS